MVPAAGSSWGGGETLDAGDPSMRRRACRSVAAGEGDGAGIRDRVWRWRVLSVGPTIL